MNVIFHIDELSKWKLLLSNVQNLVDTQQVKTIEVLANSEAVRFYQDNKVDHEPLRQLHQQGVSFVACHNSLKSQQLPIEQLLDFIVNCGFDGLHSLEPTAGVDLALVKKKVGEKLCLMGNIDIAHVLTYGTEKEVFDAVKYAIKTAGSGGGFIVSAANMHPGVNVQNLRWMVKATKKFGEYPISLE